VSALLKKTGVPDNFIFAPRKKIDPESDFVSFDKKRNQIPDKIAKSDFSGMTQNNQDGLSATVERHLRAYFSAHERGLPASGLYDRVLQEIERPLLAIVLDECCGNQLRAAELLGLNRNTLRKKLRALGLLAGRGKTARGGR
jgi:DNA-binding protein Fis